MLECRTRSTHQGCRGARQKVMAVPACESISNRGSLEPPQPLPPPPRAPGTTPVGAGATTRKVEADAKQPAIRRWTSKDKENVLKGLLKIPRGREENVDAAVAAVVAVESDGRETASAADAAAVAAAAAGVEAGAVDFTAGGGDTPGGGGTSGLMSQVEAVKAAALAVGVEVEAQPSSSPALTKLEGMTKELRLACQGLGGTATAAAAAAGEASALAGVAAAACAAWERLNAEVADQDRTKESLSQRVAAELVERDCGVAAIKKEDTMKPGDLDDGSHDSGTTYNEYSSDDTGESGSDSEGVALVEGQQQHPPPFADAPRPVPVLRVQDGLYLVNLGGTYYPAAAPPPLQQEAHGQPCWIAEGNGVAAAEYSLPMEPMQYGEHQQAMFCYGSNVEGMTSTPTPSYAQQPQAHEYGWSAPGACPSPTWQHHMLPQTFVSYENDFASMCPATTPALFAIPPYDATPVTYRGTTYYCQPPYEQPCNTRNAGAMYGETGAGNEWGVQHW